MGSPPGVRVRLRLRLRRRLRVRIAAWLSWLKASMPSPSSPTSVPPSVGPPRTVRRVKTGNRKKPSRTVAARRWSIRELTARLGLGLGVRVRVRARARVRVGLTPPRVEEQAAG